MFELQECQQLLAVACKRSVTSYNLRVSTFSSDGLQSVDRWRPEQSLSWGSDRQRSASGAETARYSWRQARHYRRFGFLVTAVGRAPTRDTCADPLRRLTSPPPATTTCYAYVQSETSTTRGSCQRRWNATNPVMAGETRHAAILPRTQQTAQRNSKALYTVTLTHGSKFG